MTGKNLEKSKKSPCLHNSASRELRASHDRAYLPVVGGMRVEGGVEKHPFVFKAGCLGGSHRERSGLLAVFGHDLMISIHPLTPIHALFYRRSRTASLGLGIRAKRGGGKLSVHNCSATTYSSSCAPPCVGSPPPSSPPASHWYVVHLCTSQLMAEWCRRGLCYIGEWGGPYEYNPNGVVCNVLAL